MLRTDPLEKSPNHQETVTGLKRLVELSATLNSTLDLDVLLKIIIQTAAEALDCEAASILLYDEKSDKLFFAAATGEDAEKLAEIPVPINDSLAGTIFKTRQPLIINQLDDDPRHNLKASEHVGFHPRSLLGIPLQIRGKTIGVLEALNKKNGPFTEADQSPLEVVASHASSAIYNGQLVQALKEAYEEVSKADQLKSNFLALASHELRTPLGIIIGYATFLREESKGENSEHAKHVLSATMQMRTLLEDMNNLTMLEGESTSFNDKEIILQEVLKKTVDETKELAEEKKQTIVFDFQEEPLIISLDENKLSTALLCLLQNAVRFSPEKEKITLGIMRKNDQAFCWIKDNGIGISKSQLKKIFERFYQVESPNIRRYSGMGIGLTIAQGLIETQGGQLWAESEGEGQGTVFKILLPLGKKDNPK